MFGILELGGLKLQVLFCIGAVGFVGLFSPQFILLLCLISGLCVSFILSSIVGGQIFMSSTLLIYFGALVTSCGLCGPHVSGFVFCPVIISLQCRIIISGYPCLFAVLSCPSFISGLSVSGTGLIVFT